MDDTGVRSEMTDATHARFREAGARYGMEAGEMTVCKLIEEDAGIDLRVKGDWLAPWEWCTVEAITNRCLTRWVDCYAFLCQTGFYKS